VSPRRPIGRRRWAPLLPWADGAGFADTVARDQLNELGRRLAAVEQRPAGGAGEAALAKLRRPHRRARAAPGAGAGPAPPTSILGLRDTLPASGGRRREAR